MHLAICAIFRNEAPYLREWIEFHRLVGVERFHLYQNRSDDAYEPIVQPYIDQGLVELTQWPRQPPCHLQAYLHFISRYAGEPWWVAFIDCDEFLFSPSYATVAEAIATIAAPEWGAVGVNWMCFGASGQETPAPGLVTERFVTRPADNFSANRHIKSVVRMDRVESVCANPHHFKVKGGTFGESGQEIVGPFSSMPLHSLLRIHHYHTKSRQEYLRRIAGGNADGAPRRAPAEFDRYQAKDIEDRSTWRFLPVLKQRIERHSEPAVVAAPAAQGPYAAYASADPAQPRQPPRDFASYRGYHHGETMLVCGCGSSLSTVVAPERFPTIGVNDVGRLFQPDYLVVINPRTQFSGDRFHHVESSRAQALFTQLDLGISHPNVVRFHLGRRGGADITDTRSLPYTRNSPYVALCLALHMGARRIGLIGVDFTDHHFFAHTGRHSLAREINQINNEYSALAETCRRLGVEVFNLSPRSRVTAFPRMSPEAFARGSLTPAQAAADLSGSKVFFVNYRFLSCGDVFADGLRHAAEDLGMESAEAWWDDAQLTGKVANHAPDLLFVVHGRNYSRRPRTGSHRGSSAVWLLDEPYEVDDTAQFAAGFDTVFVNDPSTLHRHKNAHYLPVCYDPAVYHYRPGPREHRVGFIGGANPARELMLVELAKRGLLSYAVGGPWRQPEVRRLSPSLNIPAAETAKLYQQTRIVLNVFRTAHHFNRDHIPAVSMNPRIYEALACGSMVVSERRPEIERLCPELPLFDGPQEMVSVIEGLLADPARFDHIRRACIRRLAGHTYGQRLFTAFAAATQKRVAQPWVASAVVTPGVPPRRQPVPAEPVREVPTLPGWEADAASLDAHVDDIVLHAHRSSAPGSEAGLTGRESYTDVRLTFDIQTRTGATVIAKIHQSRQHDQTSNSYHLMLAGANAYLARHDHVFHSFTLATGTWHAVELSWNRGSLCLRIDGKMEHLTRDSALPSGFCFLGIKAGTALLRNLQVIQPEQEQAPIEPPAPPATPYDLSYDSGTHLEPRISIITTVYDRVACLDACIRSVQGLKFDRYEHIIVADAPPAAVLGRIQSLAGGSFDGRHRLRVAALRARANDWGMTPAAAGLALATGTYVCFLSDDNGYKPEHFDKLAAALDQDPGLGFVYSGCLYDGRATLNAAPPAFGRVDLGQPLFRRDLFDRHLSGPWPFRCLAWDWKMIEHFLKRRVRWRHIREATFLFRLAKYPAFAPLPRRKSTENAADQAPTSIPQAGSAQAAPRPEQGAERVVLRPFTAAPRRNLMYHVWPVYGSMWRWNIEQLKKRLDLFNGRRLITIVHDNRSERPAVVERALEGWGCEFIIARNQPSGEAATFPAMLRRIASRDTNDVTFYAHAKGVKYEPDVPPNIRRWAEMSYRAALDDWQAVGAQLERFAVTGPFRRFGRFSAHRNLCDWHYHGTFFWMRHAHVFTKDCFRVPPFYCGVEAWPGLHFTRDEGGCLLLDDLVEPATEESFWTSHGAELARWEAEHPQTAQAPAVDSSVELRREFST
jgi:hypothetical protein